MFTKRTSLLSGRFLPISVLILGILSLQLIKPVSAYTSIDPDTKGVYAIPQIIGTDTTGVFRPSNGLLYLKYSNTTGFADVAINYGVQGDYPVVGDWDGDGSTSIGVYRNGSFYLRNSNTVGFAELVFAFGTPGDQPIAGDWNGDGIDTIGVFRTSTGQFLLRNSNTAGTAEISFDLGNTGDVGMAGDWNGDGIDTTGVFRPSSGVIFLKNTNSTGFADLALNYGSPGDQPVTGDWNNDGVDTIGVYRDGIFYLRNSNTVGFADLSFALGVPGDLPIAGNWNGRAVAPICSNPIGIGIMGDSDSDEYRADDARGGQYAATTLNWMEQLVKSRGLNFGIWGSWGEPRRIGFEYNWARTGATARTLITSGQHTGLAQQVSSGKVSHVVLWIGSNDFHLKNGPYAEIYNGTLSGPALDAKLNGIVTDINTAIDTILRAGKVEMVVVTIADQGASYEALLLFPDAVKRQRVTNAINTVNARLINSVVGRGIIVVDSNQIQKAVFSGVDSQGYLNFGGQKIYTLQKGNDPYHLQLGDNIGHPGTVLSGILANSIFVEPFNREFGMCVPSLSNEEILRNAGIK